MNKSKFIYIFHSVRVGAQKVTLWLWCLLRKKVVLQVKITNLKLLTARSNHCEFSPSNSQPKHTIVIWKGSNFKWIWGIIAQIYLVWYGSIWFWMILSNLGLFSLTFDDSFFFWMIQSVKTLKHSVTKFICRWHYATPVHEKCINSKSLHGKWLKYKTVCAMISDDWNPHYSRACRA